MKEALHGRIMVKKPGNSFINGWWACLLILLLTTGCAIPQRFWPQEDIAGSERVSAPTGPTVLIASRSSEYKQLLVDRLQQRLAAAGIPHQTIGIKRLEQIDATRYAAVVVINTCLAWGLDHEVSSFLDNQQETANIVLLTTSGEGDWLPEKQDRDFDAMSGASIKANVDQVAQDLMARIHTRLNATGGSR